MIYAPTPGAVALLAGTCLAVGVLVGLFVRHAVPAIARRGLARTLGSRGEVAAVPDAATPELMAQVDDLPRRSPAAHDRDSDMPRPAELAHWADLVNPATAPIDRAGRYVPTRYETAVLAEIERHYHETQES